MRCKIRDIFSIGKTFTLFFAEKDERKGERGHARQKVQGVMFKVQSAGFRTFIQFLTHLIINTGALKRLMQKQWRAAQKSKGRSPHYLKNVKSDYQRFGLMLLHSEIAGTMFNVTSSSRILQR